MKKIVLALFMLVFVVFLAVSGYAIWKYGPVGSFYAMQYQLSQIVKKMIPHKTAMAGTSLAPLSSIPFDFVEIDSTIAGDCKMVGDIDGDGYADLVIGGMPNEKLNWYRYPNWEKTVIATPGNEFTTDGALGDIDGDGDLDIIVPDGDSGTNLLWFENPRPMGNPSIGDQWVRHEIGPVGGWGKDVKPADYDGDGRMDVATRNNSVAMLFFQTSPGSWSQIVFNGANAGDEGMAMGDVDLDGDTDLILQGVWLRNPGGAAARTAVNWTQHTIGDANPAFKALVIDLNRDGKMDVLFSSSENTADVDWWTPTGNDPTGPWTKHTILPSVEKAHTLQAADMDLDGDLDVVLAQMHTSAAGEIFIMSNLDGQATDWEKQLIATGGIHNGVVADIGNDGDYDLFGANWTGKPPVKLWVNRLEATGHWFYKQVTNAHEQTFGLAFGDVNGDGLEDILSGRYWYRNPGGDMLGNWQQAAFPEGMHVALYLDVDGDALADAIAQKDETELAFYWLEAVDSTGSAWNPVRIGAVPQASHAIGAQGYRVAQVEAGSKPEILFSSGDGIYYFRIPSNPEAGNWPRIHVNANPSDEGFAAGDMDGDGDLDIAATTGDSKRVEWYRNPGDGSPGWQAFHIGDFAEALYPDRTEIADLNGDGKPDIIVTEENGGDSEAETFWWEHPADPTAEGWTRRLIVSQATTNSMDVADIEGDGDIDVVLAEHRGGKSLSIWQNDGQGNFTGYPISQGKESHLGARLVDMDGDGDLDIASIAWDEANLVHLWRNDGTSTNPPPPPSPTATAGPTATPGPVGRVTQNVVVLYTFLEGEGQTVRDVSGAGTPLDLAFADTGAVNWLDGGGLVVTSSSIIRSSGAATKVIDACRSSLAVSLEAWITSANTSQEGPARLVTLSLDPFYRNVTLGQEKDVYDVRLRTANTSENGIPSLSTPSGSAASQLTHLLYTRSSNGSAKIYINGNEQASGTIGGDLSNWDGGYALALANELTSDRPWLGSFYLVAIYNRALSPAEVQQNFVAGPQGAADSRSYLPMLRTDQGAQTEDNPPQPTRTAIEDTRIQSLPQPTETTATGIMLDTGQDQDRGLFRVSVIWILVLIGAAFLGALLLGAFVLRLRKSSV